MNKYVVENRIQPRIVGICEVVAASVLMLVLLVELFRGSADGYTIPGMLSTGVLFVAAALHCASLVLFRIEIGNGTLTIRSWQTVFCKRTVETATLDPVRFVSGGPAYSPLLVLSCNRRKLARVSAFCTNADELEKVLRAYGKWKEQS